MTERSVREAGIIGTFEWRSDLRPLPLTTSETNLRSKLGLVQPGAPWLVRADGTPSSEEARADWSRSLLRQFAGLELTQESIKAFAAAYGVLGIPVQLSRDEQWGTRQTVERQDVEGESFEDWVNLIRRVRELLHIVDLLQDRDDVALKQLVVWDNAAAWWQGERQPEQLIANRLVIADPDTTLAFALAGLATPRPVRARPGGDARRLAQTFLVRHINHLLRASARPAIHASRRSSVVMVPVGLLGAIAVALAAEVQGRGTRARACRHCGKVIGERRRDAVYCDKTCKVNWFYYHSPKSPRTPRAQAAAIARAR